MTQDLPNWARQLLGEARIARLGTADAQGRPLVVPICYAFDGTCLYSAVDAKPKRTRALRRLANIRDNPKVSLLVDHYDEDWTALRYVLVFGDGAILTEGAEFSRAIDLLVAKYPQYRQMQLDRARGTVIKIQPHRFAMWRSA